MLIVPIKIALYSLLLVTFVNATKLQDAYRSEVAAQAKIASGRGMRIPKMSVSSRSEFECPDNLAFAFDCECFLNSLGRFPRPENIVQVCQQRLELYEDDDDDDDDDDEDDDDDGDNELDDLCATFVELSDPIEMSAIISLENSIFGNCSDLVNQLCPDNPSYNLRECQCFIVPEAIQPAFCDSFDFDAMSEEEIENLEDRCSQVERFKQFPGSFAGLTVRLCITGIGPNCCQAL